MTRAALDLACLIRAQVIAFLGALGLGHQVEQRFSRRLAVLILRLPDDGPVRVAFADGRRDGEPAGQLDVQLDFGHALQVLHEAAQVKVSFKRVKGGVEITIEDFLLPTILERLRQQNKNNPLFQPEIDDWRAMVDRVMIDTAYNMEVFNIALADVPAKKNDLVEWKYLVDAAEGARGAVKMTDMLGEEVLSV